MDISDRAREQAKQCRDRYRDDLCAFAREVLYLDAGMPYIELFKDGSRTAWPTVSALLYPRVKV